MNIFDMPPDQFMGALAELRQQGVDTDALLRQYRAQSSPLAPINQAAQSASASVADQGRREVAGGLLTKQAGTTGMDAIRSLDTNFRGGLLGMLAGGGRAVDAPMAAAQGLIPQGDMALEALGTAGLASMGGAAATRPSGSFGMGGRVADALPEPRNAAERMARQILDMRAAGRAGDVTDEMMAAADPQYMFANTPLPMDEASRMARAQKAGFTTGRDRQDVMRELRGLDNPQLVHYTNKDFNEFRIPERENRQAIWATPDPSVNLATKDNFQNFSDEGVVGIPVMGRMTQRVSPYEFRMAGDPMTPGFPRNVTARDVAKANSVGADYAEAGLEYAIFDPSNIRSRFARFDPEFSHLSNLNAANASATSGAAATSASQDRLQSLRSYLQSIPGLLAN